MDEFLILSLIFPIVLPTPGMNKRVLEDLELCRQEEQVAFVRRAAAAAGRSVFQELDTELLQPFSIGDQLDTDNSLIAKREAERNAHLSVRCPRAA